MAGSNGIVRAGLVLLHLIFLVGVVIAAIDVISLLQSSSSEEWGGIGVFAVSVVLGLPWSLGILVVMGMLPWEPSIWLMGISLVANYALLIWLTPGVWKGRE